MAKKKVAFNALKKLTVKQRVDTVSSPGGESILASLTPTDFALLFPKYYQKALPDVGGFRLAISKATQEQQQKYYDAVDEKLGTTSPGAEERIRREGTTRRSGGSGATGGLASVGASGKSVAVDVGKRLIKDYGLTDYQAAGILAHLGHESAGFKTNIQEGKPIAGRGGFGLAQWTGPRRVALENFAAKNGMNISDVNTQYAFMVQEPEFKRYIQSVKNAKSMEEAAQAFAPYESGGDSRWVAAWDSRYRYGRSALSWLSGKEAAGGVEGATGPAGSGGSTGTPGTSSNMVGKSFANAKGNTECAAYAQMAGGVGHTSGWKPGQGASSGGLKPGDWVAAFHGDKYMNIRNRDNPGNGSHVARFESYIYDEKGKVIGMNVTHQYNGSGGVIPGKFMFGQGGEFDANRYHQIVDRGNPASMNASDGTDIKIQERKQYLAENPEADAGDQVSPGQAQVEAKQQVTPPEPAPHLPAAASPEVRQQDLTAKVEKPAEKKQAPSKSEPVRYKFNQAEFIKEVRAKETGAMFVSDEYIMGETIKGFQTTPGVKFDKKSGTITIDDPNSPAIQTITNDMKSHGFDQDKFLTRQGGPSAEGPSATVDKSPAAMPTDEEAPPPAFAGGGRQKVTGDLSFAPMPPKRGDNLLVTDSAGKQFTMNTKENISVNPNSQTATITHRKDLGTVASKYESAGRGVETVSSGRMGKKGKDPGGVSYGAHQLTSRTPGAKKQTGGTMGEFLRSKEGEPFRERLGSETPGTASFSKIYKDIAKNDREKFTEAQHNFITRTLYEPTQRKAAKLGYNVEDPKVQEALYSISVQHGRGGASRILRKASHMAGSSSEKQVESIFNVRSRSFPEFAKKRYSEERKNILAFKPSDEMTAPDKTQVAAAGQKDQGAAPTPKAEMAGTEPTSIMNQRTQVASADKQSAKRQEPSMFQKFKKGVLGMETAAAEPMQSTADVGPTQQDPFQIEPSQRAFPMGAAPDPFIGQIQSMKEQMGEMNTRMDEFGPMKQVDKQNVPPVSEPQSPDYLNNLLQTSEKPYFNPTFRRAMSRATSGMETVDETGGNHYSFGTKSISQ